MKTVGAELVTRWVATALLLALAWRAEAVELSGGGSAAPEWQQLEEVRDAIRAKRLDWTAGLTSNGGLPPSDLGRLAGAAAPDFSLLSNLLSFVPASADVPPEWDWRDKGIVTPVKTQTCNSCWAFATAAAVESYVLKTYGRGVVPQVDLSEQTLIDKSGANTRLSPDGCGPGITLLAAEYVQRFGLPAESNSPFLVGRTNRIGRWLVVPGTVDAMKEALYRYGPLLTHMQVLQDFAKFYRGGVYSVAVDEPRDLTFLHAVLIVGYSDSESAFIVKNSWGTKWGDEGFFKIAYSEVGGRTDFGRLLGAPVGSIALDKTNPFQVVVKIGRPRDLEVVQGALRLQGGAKALPKPIDPLARLLDPIGTVVLMENLGFPPSIAYLQARIDGGEFETVGLSGTLSALVDRRRPGGHMVEVRAFDNIGNSATARARYVVPYRQARMAR